MSTGSSQFFFFNEAAPDMFSVPAFGLSGTESRNYAYIVQYSRAVLLSTFWLSNASVDSVK